MRVSRGRGGVGGAVGWLALVVGGLGGMMRRGWVGLGWVGLGWGGAMVYDMNMCVWGGPWSR